MRFVRTEAIALALALTVAMGVAIPHPGLAATDPIAVAVRHSTVVVTLVALTPARVEIVDMTGRTRAALTGSASTRSFRWDGSAQAPGTYFARVTSADVTSVKSFTITN